jgi:molybdopterin/thiamine biosynthesis adenylyltransferase
MKLNELTPEEIERYARHIVLAGVGGPGQQKLRASKVLVVGAGGLGSPAIAYLAAAGVGTLGIADDDTVSLSNLQRQILHDTASIGEAKVASARRFVERINPHVRVITHAQRLDADNAAAIVADYDLVVDGSDSYETRICLADACEAAKRTLVSAAVGQFDASITTLKPHETDEKGRPLPRYRDIFPERPPAEMTPSCAQAGVLGALTGIIGAMQAMEAIKEITGAGESLAGRLLLYDARTTRFETIRFRRRTQS